MSRNDRRQNALPPPTPDPAELPPPLPELAIVILREPTGLVPDDPIGEKRWVRGSSRAQAHLIPALGMVAFVVPGGERCKLIPLSEVSIWADTESVLPWIDAELEGSDRG